MKAFTDLEQSKKLADILPIGSADMCYEVGEDLDGYLTKTIYTPLMHTPYNDKYIPCWSLAALLSAASTYCSRLEITLRADKKYNVFAVKDDFVFHSFDNHPDGFDNPVDGCVEMILKLKENELI